MHNWHWWWFIIVNGQVLGVPDVQTNPLQKKLYIFPSKSWFMADFPMKSPLSWRSLRSTLGIDTGIDIGGDGDGIGEESGPGADGNAGGAALLKPPLKPGSRDVKSVGIKKHGIYWYLLTVVQEPRNPSWLRFSELPQWGLPWHAATQCIASQRQPSSRLR